jgi:protein-S-isoprenylcysteine O-methyltransferase Ste14
MDVALFIVIGTIWSYWATVILLAWYQRVRHGRSAGILPRQRYERQLWLLILPVVAGWLFLPILAGNTRLPLLGLPAWFSEVSWVTDLRRLAAVLAAVCYALSLYCWLSLGRHWSMAIVPGQTSQVVTAGPYRWVRHPIYSLQVAIMLMSVIVVPTAAMVLLACLHLVAMNLKARNEERHLAQSLGTRYLDYCQRVGRFWPRLSAR